MRPYDHYPLLATGEDLLGVPRLGAAARAQALLGPQLVAGVLLLGGGATATAWLVAAPLGLAAAVFAWRGIETRERSLTEIQVAISD